MWLRGSQSANEIEPIDGLVHARRRSAGRSVISAPRAWCHDVGGYGMSRRTKMLAGSVDSVWVNAAMNPPLRTARPM